MQIIQKEITLTAKSRGMHLVTDEITREVPEIKEIKSGIVNIFIQHTSSSLSINENADPDVRTDMENYFNKIVPEREPYFEHNSEGPDDMPAHIKAVLLGCSLIVPVTDGGLNLGTWQGIYLCEHRNKGGRRKLVITVMGE
jgi:secondary thiamine-phosphate synthase enzyme